jgi:hypothetical protein
MSGLVGVDAKGHELYLTGVTNRRVPQPLWSSAFNIGLDKAAEGVTDGFTPVIVGFVRPPQGDYPAGARFVRVMFGSSSVSHIDVAFIGNRPVCVRKATWRNCTELPLPAPLGRAERDRRANTAIRNAIIDGRTSGPAR